MRVKLLFAAALPLAFAAPPVASYAMASPAWCGTGLVAGLSICLSWEMKASEYRALIARANAGDRDAALTLAQFEEERTDIPGSGRGEKWWRLAAERGECQALRRMRNVADHEGKRADAAKWRTRIRWNKCAPNPGSERWMGGYYQR